MNFFVAKFKIWDRRQRKFWFEGRGITLLELAMSYRELLAVGTYDFVIFTGAKDMNGTEIYDGDFLKYPESGNRTIVFYDPYAAQFVPLGNEEWRKGCVVDGHAFDVDPPPVFSK